MDKHPVDIKLIFGEALEKKTAGERAAYLDKVCGNNADLRNKIEELLKAYEEADDVPEAPIISSEITLDSAPLTEGPGTKIGHYKLLQLIGEGGFGVVYMAEQESPIRRRVALKIIKLGMDTKQVVARFEAERQALAMMEHPNIAKVFDGGATETGRPYFVMELVKGMPITEYCDQNNLDAQQRLELFVDVCKAVQHAHQKGIIHRDIKPSNVMITLHDGKPVPKVIDFGIAKATQHRLTEKTLFTEYRQFIGTPEYMSPEQAEMSGLDVDTRSDIYSLGVLLYELLTGTTPFDAEKLRSAAYDEIRRIIREDEPPKPSTRLSTLGDTLSEIARHRNVQPGELRRIVRGDLDWIVMKSLEKDRTRRYETANDLAQDIYRHLSDEPVLAGPPDTVYRVRKFFRRNRTLVTGAGIVLLVLLAGIVVSTIFAIGQSRARRQADGLRATAEAATVKEKSARVEAVVARDRAQSAEKVAEEQRRQAQRLLAESQIDRGVRLLNEDNCLGLLDLLEAWITTDEISELRDHASRLWAIAYDLSSDRLVQVFGDEGGHQLVYSPDGRLLATAQGTTAQLWDTATGQPHGSVLHLERFIDVIAFSPDGKLLATHSLAGVSRLWEVATGTPAGPVLQSSGSLDRSAAKEYYSVNVRWSAAFSPDGKLFATASLDGTVGLWETETGRPFGQPIQQEHEVWTVAFSPDGKLLASGSEDGAVRMWEVAGGQPHGPVLQHNNPVRKVAFSPDGTLVATMTWGRAFLQLWETRTGRLHKQLLHEPGWTTDFSFSPDGQLLAALLNRMVRLWDTHTGEEGESLRHEAPVTSVAFSPDGRLLATGSRDRTVRLWDLSNNRPYGQPLPHPGGVDNVVFSPDGQYLASRSWPGAARLWRTFQPLKTAVMQRQTINNLGTVSADGKVGATILGNAVRLYDATTFRPIGEPFRCENGTSAVALSPDGRLLATGSVTWRAMVFGADTGQLLHNLRCEGGVESAAFSPDGKVLATGSTNGVVQLWDMTSGSQIAFLIQPGAEVWAVKFSPDGNVLAAASGEEGRTIRLWDVRVGPPYHSLEFPAQAVTGKKALEAFETDGTIFVQMLPEAKARVWRLPKTPTDLHEMQLKTWVSLGLRQNQRGETTAVQSGHWHRLPQALARKLRASNPQLIDMSDSIGLLNVKIVWTPASDAVAHKVYFGTDPNKLKFMGKVDEPCYANLPALDRDTTYWWRVDTVKSDGSEVKSNPWKSLTGKMVGWWKFNETSGNIAYDSSGGDNHGTLEQVPPPAPPLWKPAGGRFNGALQFDGVDDYVNCGNDNRLNITDQITLAAWVKTNDAGNDEYNPYVTKGDHSYGIKHQNSNNIEFVIYEGDWRTVRYPVNSSFNGAWHHLAGTYDGSQLKLYIDGELETTYHYAGSIAGSTFNVNIGRNSEETERFYSGLIDDVAIFSRALDVNEIAKLRDNGAACFVGDPNLEALWELNESGGQTAYDSSGNGIVGSLEPDSPPRQPATDGSDGELVGGPQWIDGRIGGALRFDGEDDFVSLPIGSLISTLDRATIMLWVDFSNEGGPWQRIFDFGNDTTVYMFLTPRLDFSGPMRFAITTAGVGDPEQMATAPITLPSGWHNVAVTISTAGIISLYLDGSLVAEDTAATLTPSDLGVTTSNWLGRSQYPTDAYFNGSIDDLRIYDYALSPDEVAAVYAGEEEGPERWVIDVSKEEYAPPKPQPGKADQYYLPLEAEQAPREHEELSIEELNILCSVLSGSEEPEVAQLWGQRGNIYLRLQQWDKAIADYSKAIELNPEDWWYWHERGYVYMQLDKWDKVITDYTKAISLNPDDWSNYNRRARAYQVLGQFDKAISDFTKAIELDPLNLDHWRRRAEAYLKMQQWDKAISDYSKGIELDPNNAYLPYVRALAYLGMGETEGYRKGCAQMLDHFGETEDAVAAHWVAWTCALASDAAEDFNRVIKLAELMVEKASTTEQNLVTLGAVLYRAGRFDEAVRKLGELTAKWEQGEELSIQTSPAYTWFFLAMAHHQLGDADESQKYFDLAVKRSEEETASHVPWNRRLTLRLLREEAAKLLGIPQ